MGKRKRRSDNKKTPPPPDLAQCEPTLDLTSEQRSSEPAESSATQRPPSFMEALNNSIKKSPLDQNHGPTSHLLLSRTSRHTLGRHYSRRNSNITCDASPSNSKGPPYDHKLSFILDRQDISGSPYSDSRGQIFVKPERIRSNSFAQNGDLRKMVCRICNKRLRKHPFVIDNSISSSDLSVVAVLVCGHTYHADCLDQKTDQEEKHDPTCPLCVCRT
ncbi:RING/U-box superfamily protein [Striga asiatica]|uniref:RING/U-box superfamily protein n=1 Tax=Striga asiatica TaxID=4170 RepID=A0A5A7R1J8_STRAF|nr:RING/U-box superfamily protein [Striga asiatica]